MRWVRVRCDANACVEVAAAAHGFVLRSTERPDVWVELTSTEWWTFVAAVKDGKFDHAEGGGSSAA